MAQDGIHAGFPSPATDYMTQAIDLNKELVKHPAATFYGRVVGDSMIDAGVDEGDILVIDKCLEPQEGDMAVCFHSNNDFFNYACVRNNIPHFHNCWELHFLKSGSGVLEINSSERHILSAGDLCIIPPDVLHLLEPEPKTEHTG